MGAVIWAAIAVLILVFFWWANRLLARENQEDRFDAGLAIIEFGRVYPDQAIRQVMTTKDASMIFVRLWDGGAGCMRPAASHYQCHLIEPGQVRVRPTENPNALEVEFPGSGFHGGVYEFRNAREASEVSLWLLGSFVSAAANDLGFPSSA